MYFQDLHLTPGRFSFPVDVEDEPDELAERLRKTLYYGKPPRTERPSLPLTGLAVEFFHEAAPKELGKLDTYFAASSSRSACISPSSVMAGMLYTRRLRKKNPQYLHQVSSSDLFLISMMMASKFMYDEGVDEEVFNDEWADAGNMDVEDINQLEREFLAAIDWELFVKPQEFSEMLHMIERRIALQQGTERGWFSYCDLWVLSQNAKLLTWSSLSADLSKVVAVCSLAYLAGILTMVCSTILATTVSTGLVSLGSSLVLRSLETPVTVPAVINTGEFQQTHDLPELDMSLMDSVVNTGAIHSTSSEDYSLNTGNGSKPDAEHAEEIRPRSSLNRFLPPLLALVSLKDSFLDFVNAVRNRGADNHYITKQSESSFDKICSAGPCQQETWPNCWNTSDEWDISYDCMGGRCCESSLQNDRPFQSQNCWELGRGCQNCGARMRKACPINPHQEQQASLNVRCCCSVKGHYSVSSGIDWLHPAFSELSALGFMTGPGYPVFVTT